MVVSGPIFLQSPSTPPPKGSLQQLGGWAFPPSLFQPPDKGSQGVLVSPASPATSLFGRPKQNLPIPSVLESKPAASPAMSALLYNTVRPLTHRHVTLRRWVTGESLSDPGYHRRFSCTFGTGLYYRRVMIFFDGFGILVSPQCLLRRRTFRGTCPTWSPTPRLGR